MSSITEVASAQMERVGFRSYVGQAQPVLRALEDREAEIVRNLTSAATNLGLPEAEARDLLRECGLTVPVFTVQNQGQGGEDTPAWAQQIMQRLDSLTDFARRNGYSG